mgnify:FL=1
MGMTFGAHLSIAGGYEKALERAAAIGANCLQMFSGNPRSFSGPTVGDTVGKAFAKKAKEFGVAPVYFHAPYLVNLASEEMTGELSEKLLIKELKAAAFMGVRGSIVHLGSFKKAEGEEKERQYTLLIERVTTILEETPKAPLFIIENAGTRKIGQTMEEIAGIIREVKGHGQRLQVCLDTCHLHAAGYDISSKEKLDDFLALFDKLIGLEKLECFHINDSRDEFGSLRDRHDNIGEGKIPKDVFRLALNHPKLKALPFLLEVPGFDDQGPDKKNLDLLKAMVE